MPIYMVVVGVALKRPLYHKGLGLPYEPDEFRKYVLIADSAMDARLLASWFSAHDSVMPVYASEPELLEKGEQ